MPDYFRESFEGLRTATQQMQTAHGFIVEANHAMQQASHAMQRAGDAMTGAMSGMLQAKEEHEDLRVTVARLEGLVLDLTAEVRALRRARGQ